MKVGTTKEQGLYNKPSAAVHPGALAAGSLPQYNTTLPCTLSLKTLNFSKTRIFMCSICYRKLAVAQLVEALWYKPEDSGFDF